MLGDVTSVVRNVRRTAKVITVIEESFLFCSVIMDAEISGYHVRITDMERSVCDAVKYRNKLGLDICAEVIRSYLKKPNRNLTRLQDYAKRLRVSNTLKNYLEIAIE